MNILVFLYGLRDPGMKSRLWQPEALDTALSSEAWHDKRLHRIGVGRGGGCLVVILPVPLGQEKSSNPMAGFAIIPLTKQAPTPTWNFCWRTCFLFTGQLCWQHEPVYGRNPRPGKAVVVTHTPHLYEGLPVTRADRFSIFPHSGCKTIQYSNTI